MIVTVTLNAAIDKRYEVEQLGVGKVNRVQQCRYSAGGKGLNVARVASIAREEVMATGFVAGYTGSLIENLANKDGIHTDFIHTQGESRTCINILDTTKGIQTEFLEGGPEVGEAFIEQMRQKYKMLLDSATIITISGSVPKGVTSQFYIEMIEQAKEAKIPVLLDTSGQLLKDCIAAKPDLIKPNQDEIEQILGKTISGRAELIEKGEELCQRGIGYVVISLGADGSLLITKEHIYQAKVPKIQAVNTVGCGDSMLAGLAIGLKNKWELGKTLRFASAVSAANALQAATGFYEKTDFEWIYPEIQIEKIK